MRVGICLIAGITAQFLEEKFGTLCEARIDDLSALQALNLNETEMNAFYPIAMGVVRIKESIR